MPVIGTDFQIILQTERRRGEFDCQAFADGSVMKPCLIVLATCGSPAALADAARLRRAIIAAIQGTRYRDIPCRGRVPTPEMCHAHDNNHCEKLLVLIGDGVTPIAHERWMTLWQQGNVKYHVLPVLPAGVDPATHLPPGLHWLQAHFWTTSVDESLPDILRQAQLAPAEMRVFISYRPSETRAIAEQLHDALGRVGFDVYLDHYRTPPGVDFARRIFQELADKSVLLVLESPGILASPWTTFEITYAVSRRFGLYAVRVPGGRPVPYIHGSQRRVVQPGELTGAPEILADAALDEIVQGVRREHAMALARRYAILRASMRLSLALHRVYDQRVGEDGLIHVDCIPGGAKQYSILMAPRPPMVTDFRITDACRGSQATGVVLGQVDPLELGRRANLDWLSDISGIRHYEEARMYQVAGAIAGGTV